MPFSAKYATTLEHDDVLFPAILASLPPRARTALQADQPQGVAHVDIELRGTHSRGTEAYFDRDFGNYLPGDPDETEITNCFVKVRVGGRVEAFDVTSAFSGDQLSDCVARVSEYTDLHIEDPYSYPNEDYDWFDNPDDDHVPVPGPGF